MTAGAVLAGRPGLIVIAVLALVAAAGIAYAVADIALRRRRPDIEKTLGPYRVGEMGTPRPHAAHRQTTQELVDSPVLQRAVLAVGAFAARRGILQYLENELVRAAIMVRPAEALFLYGILVVAATAIGYLVGGIIGLVVGAAVFAVAPWIILKAVADRRTKAFTSQLPDMLQLLATTLRSGFSILQGLDTVSRQLSEPTGEEMRKVVTEARLGRPLIEALDDLAKRIQSEDFDWVVTAIAIQREVGGNLAELLDIVAGTMQERERLRREVGTLTAEGRIGAIVISIMPIAIGLFVYAVNPSYISPLWHSSTGKIFFFGSIILAVAGIFWLRTIVDIEY
ncbi:MAG TPA: type II secretion system F family protein [Acidimicrobiales bacterium]|nr:type II secretion system F family protein [Acidimicrobiales bacterium]